jgi:transcription antitermination factor NusG
MLARNDSLYGLDGSAIDFLAPRAWVAFVARSGKEQDSADWFKNARLFAYWPCYGDQVRHWRGRANGIGSRSLRMKALIPGYLFVAVRDGVVVDPFVVVRQVPGITGYMRGPEGYPAMLGEADIQTIRRIEAGQNLPFDPKGAHKFKTGDKVRFCDDLMRRWPYGKVARLAADGRISVDVALLGRVVPVTVYPHQIEAM